ncbi:hypothetical protein PV356_35520 [Streptomyces sp. WI03-5b]|uniref:hypothetical protein n=1 Tax=Streptomyces sp. WI03-5b TaxID=462946 RepID=UPI0029BEA377|nr:hypothetical protein [Streptomyces sp. WI03-5b]MDX2624727.1 hypothetical protein [Streptomyces sp. WI03-5b]
MSMTQTIRRAAAVALLAALPALAAPAAEATQADRTAVVADDPGWGVAPAAIPAVASAPTDAGWG